jgi:hypothetical protein
MKQKTKQREEIHKMSLLLNTVITILASLFYSIYVCLFRQL